MIDKRIESKNDKGRCVAGSAATVGKGIKSAGGGNVAVGAGGDIFIEDIVRELTEDFLNRQRERRGYEQIWQLNMNFLTGNQYCSIGRRGEIEEDAKSYFWQEREVFNHLAPIVETRLAKLGRVRPKMSVRAQSSDDNDLYTAKTSSQILNSIYQKHDLGALITAATMWSEVCGTVFYKIVWDNTLGEKLFADENGAEVFEGDISITICPPYEIFPDGNAYGSVEECNSIIHARAYSEAEVKDIWGEDIKGCDVDVYGLESGASIGGLGVSSVVGKIGKNVKHNQVIVIERYEKPCRKFPDGRLTIIAGDKLLYMGVLPFQNGVDGRRGFPFVRQVAVLQAGSFFGTSIIERTIPIQRSYNAVKNRKHEFLNRIAMGVLAVEDGSLDVENLEEEGLSPGKVLIYRQGSNPPSMMDSGRVPGEFSAEEDRLMNEFIYISGVSELMRHSASPTNVSSGVALQLLIEQDDTRLSTTADHIRNAIKRVAEHIMRLFKQFAKVSRLSKVVGSDGNIELFYFEASDISSDDISFDTENELNDTPSQKRSLVFDMLKAGLLYDQTGNLDQRARVKVLDLLGFGSFMDSQDISRLHIKRAAAENLELFKASKQAGEIDEHDLHLSEHIRYMLSGEYEGQKKKNKKIEEYFLSHIRSHKQMQKAANDALISGAQQNSGETGANK
jgi:hypothetical protein